MRMTRYPQSGVGLVEVLVTMLVLAVGLLGLAALQNSALRFNHNAYLESQAQFLIRDIVESMRTADDPQQFAVKFGETGPTGVKDCTTEDCATNNELADWYLSEWIKSVRSALPGADVQIRLLSAADSEYEVVVKYDDLRGDDQSKSAHPIPQREVSVVTRI